MAKRTFVCVDCKKESECGPVGIVPKRCEPCKEVFKKKDAAERRAAKGAKPRGRKAARAARVVSDGGGALAELLDARIRDICNEQRAEKAVVEGTVRQLLEDLLPNLVDARIRAVFAGRAKA